MTKRKGTYWLAKVLFFLGLIVLWQAIYFVGVDVFRIWKSYIFPSPLGVLAVGVDLVADGSLWIAIGSSVKRIVVGYTVSVLIGVVLGLIISKFQFVSENLRPIILGLQTLPSICWLPFAILWFGLNESAIIFVIVIGSSFSVCMAVESGIKSINPLFINVARTMGSRGWHLYSKVILPASLPSVVSGLKQGWSFAWRALMAGEMLSSTKGLGQILMLGRDIADINQVMCIMIVIVVLGTVVDYFVFGKIENNLRLKWGLAK